MPISVQHAIGVHYREALGGWCHATDGRRRGVAGGSRRYRLDRSGRPARALSGSQMMEIADLLTPRGVIAHLRVGSKKQVLQEIARRAASITGVAERRIYDVLAERERLGTTGIGRGI